MVQQTISYRALSGITSSKQVIPLKPGKAMTSASHVQHFDEANKHCAECTSETTSLGVGCVALVRSGSCTASGSCTSLGTAELTVWLMSSMGSAGRALTSVSMGLDDVIADTTWSMGVVEEVAVGAPDTCSSQQQGRLGYSVNCQHKISHHN